MFSIFTAKKSCIISQILRSVLHLKFPAAKFNSLHQGTLRISLSSSIVCHTNFTRYLSGSKLCYIEDNSTTSNQEKVQIDLTQFPIENIRNFSIIAHIDHGKSTLADRLLELTGAISKESENKQVLDKLPVERERGITVKAQTASLFYEYQGTVYLLNLIDTPGHVDFSYEVSRSLAACQGVILLVDSNQGVQAQTVANFFQAFVCDLVIVPVLNKIDLQNADPDGVAEQMNTLFDMNKKDILKISAKLGTGVEEVLQAVITRIPAPKNSQRDQPLRALLFDSWYMKYKGAVLLVALIDGELRVGDKISSVHSNKTYEVKELGILRPHEVPVKELLGGQVGYVICNMKSTAEAHIGDTLTHANISVDPLPGFKPAKPMVFAGMYPMDQTEHQELKKAIEKLTLNDSSVAVSMDSSPALGQGWRLGFLGLLHMDVFSQRLEQEYDAEVVITAPNVPYRAKITGEKNIKKLGGKEIAISNPVHWPDPTIVSEYLEPTVIGTIITPDVYIGPITTLCIERRGLLRNSKNITNDRVMLTFKLPLNEIALDFYDRLKSVSSGYASFDYEENEYEPSNLLKMNILLNGTLVDELSTIVHASRAGLIAKQICSRLKDVIPRQLYQIAIQATVGKQILARENIKPFRKDVTAKCYGGDISRKMKLLKRQAEGKKRMKYIGNVQLPRDTFIKVLQR